ncbi:aspartic endopeptidase [Magnaporthiopsis poae ATCC 64411]|uniref:Aspartic endopeptidase n=1 Tax=Magnaporthiopsis poae (strain ATCC 64411 / 73-15) TaxID=644358 RepID=A0A0C4DZM1_MAGP6|nr:aspartic endopeptidase [Magnaporthiopsis poae ATCC 64411]
MSEAHAETKEDVGISRVTLLLNPTYWPSGIETHASLLGRRGFKPNKPGPYCYRNRMHQRGLANVPGAAGGRGPRVARSSQSQQTVSAATPCILCGVDLGTPAQRLKLEFNTGLIRAVGMRSRPEPRIGQPRVLRHGTIRRLSKHEHVVDGQGGWWQLPVQEAPVSTKSLGGLQVKEQAIQLPTHLEGHPAPSGAAGCLELSIFKTTTIRENGVPDPQGTFVVNMISRSGLPTDARLLAAVLDRAGDEAFCAFGHIDQDTMRAADEAPVRTGNKAVADSSSPLTLVGDDVCEATEPSSLPKLWQVVGEARVRVDATELLFSEAGPDHWYGALQSRDDNAHDILGNRS